MSRQPARRSLACLVLCLLAISNRSDRPLRIERDRRYDRRPLTLQGETMMTIRTLKSLALGVAVSVFTVGCCDNHKDHDHASANGSVIRAADMGMDVKDAVAVLRGTDGNDKVTGWVKFSDTGAGVKVTAHLEGLAPGSEHGFHIHEFGDLTDMAKGMSLGGHYNPEKHEHGKPGEMSHVGDMGNVKADDKGVAHAEVTLPAATLTGKNAILGRGVVLHANADKFTQPAGDAGGRMAIGAIGIAQVKK
jgi:Cu-Zn family superoxide dismutase